MKKLIERIRKLSVGCLDWIEEVLLAAQQATLKAEKITAALRRGDLTMRDALQAVALGQEDLPHVRQVMSIAKDVLRLSDGELELDEDTSIAAEVDDNGAYVMTWSWVDFTGTELDKEPDNE